MARQGRLLLILGGAGVLLLAGTAVAAASKPVARKPESDDSGHTEQDDPDHNARKNHEAGFKRALDAWVNAAQLAVRNEAEREREQKASGKTAAALTSAAGALAANIPTIGPLIAVAAQLFALLFKELGYGAFLLSTEGRIFTGWKARSYFFKDVPVFGPAWDKLRSELEPLSTRGNPAPLNALESLALTFPFGPPVEEVQVSDTGDYFYLFNPTNPGDLSATARAEKKVFGMVVFSPADITERGPRGFDPAKPLAWKVPGERASIYDRVIHAEPGNPAAAL